MTETNAAAKVSVKRPRSASLTDGDKQKRALERRDAHRQVERNRTKRMKVLLTSCASAACTAERL
jgi:hypothetical protein